jgi:hypothetical protein
MRDFKCVACKIRTRRAEDSVDAAPDACPGCGSPLEPAGELAELVGFRQFTTAPRDTTYAQRVSAAMTAGPGR